MRKIFLLAVLIGSMCQLGFSQQKGSTNKKPKLVVGIVVDQMRWDYLYRFYSKYGEGGFKRMLNQGFSFDNVQIDYLPSHTAVGHTCIFTGSVPGVTGIVGNNWYDRVSGKKVYCSSDNTVEGVGSKGKSGKMSPRNLWVSTVTDELRMASELKSKVVGVSIKDRAAIFPAGHNPTGAFWFDKKASKFITSTYYTDKLPKWVEDFNKKDEPKKLMTGEWNTVLPIDQYVESTKDNSPWESLAPGKKEPVFPYNLSELRKKDPSFICTTPFGNTLTLDFAMSAVKGNDLGKDNYPDILTINLASTDYVAHFFGVKSVEVEDTYLRLDKDLENFFKYLDKEVGKGEYLVFLTADHGAWLPSGYLKHAKMPTGQTISGLTGKLNDLLNKKFGVADLVRYDINMQVYLNRGKISSNNLDFEKIKKCVKDYLRLQDEILYVVDLDNINQAPLPAVIANKLSNSSNFQRSGDIQIIYKDNYTDPGYKTGNSHDNWNSYDAHIPLIFMGTGIKTGKSRNTYHMTDIAPTISNILKIENPSGNVGNILTPLFQ